MIKGHSIAGTSTKRERIEDDYYATPPEAIRELLNNFGLYGQGSFLEPACGEGHISKEIQKWFDNANPKYGLKLISNDLVYRGYGNGEIDFLKMTEEEKYDVVITNPPFKLAKEFIQKGLKISNKYVIMFAKIQLLEGLGRKELFENHPPKYIYVFRNRINPLRNGSPVDEKGKPWASTMCFAWFVWEVGFKGEPTIRWLETKRGVSELKLSKAQSPNISLKESSSEDSQISSNDETSLNNNIMFNLRGCLPHRKK